MLSTPSFVVIVLPFLAKEISCCVVIPREFLTTVGEVVSLECKARPNNEQRGSVSNLKLENEDKSETLIFQSDVYNSMGKKSTEQFVADGYFLSKLDENLVNATILINETQLKHGGRYLCDCTAGTISTGSGNLVVLADKLSFVRNGGNPPTPGEQLDLICSLSFSGSISSVTVDLTINDANGTQLAAKGNLYLTSSSQGSHYVSYSFNAHRSKEQNFTCEMKAWNQSSFERRLLRLMTSGLNINRNEYSTIHNRHPEANLESLAFGYLIGLIFLCCVVVILFAVIVLMCNRLHRLSVIANQKCEGVTARSNYESIYQEQRIAGSNEVYEDLNLNDHSIQTGQYMDVVL